MRLIDRDAIHWRPDENWELYATAADIRAIPIVDAVVVTRCKDCKYSCEDRTGRTCEGYWHELSEFAVAVKDNDFCSYGKPKEGENADDYD